MIYNLFGERDGWEPIGIEPTKPKLGRSHLDSVMFFGRIQGRLVLINGAGSYPADELGLRDVSYVHLGIGGGITNGGPMVYNMVYMNHVFPSSQMLMLPCENSLGSIAAVCDANIGQIPMRGELRDNEQRIHETCVRLSHEQRMYTRDEYIEACGRFGVEPMADTEVDCYGIRYPDAFGGRDYGVNAIITADLAARRLRMMDAEKPPQSVSIPAWFTEQFSRCNQCGEHNPQTTIAGGGVCDDCL